MKKVYSLLIIALLSSSAKAINYYVDAVNGNNANTGLSTAQAFQTIQTAANRTAPGDTVFIMNGTYTASGTILNIPNSGSAGLPIAYTAYPGHSPKIQASITSYNLVNIAPGVSYITINGLEVIGWGVNMSLATDTIPAQAQQTCTTPGSPSTNQAPVNKYNQNGINSDSRSLGTTGNHHIVITNNVVHDCGGGGIAVNQCDYVTIEGNTSYNNSWYTIYGTSGISVNNFFNFDNNTATYRNIFRNNTSYNNRMYVLWRAVCQITDGNGLILDIPLSDYTGKSLVANNIVYNNGGSGIHSFKMNHVDILHNTGYYNSQSPAINSGEIYARQADDIKIYNNVLMSKAGKAINGAYSTTNLVYDYNVYWGSVAPDQIGTHSLIQDPRLLSPSTNPATADFHLLPGSVAIDRGDNTHSTALDKEGVVRPVHSIVDIGAYEPSLPGSFTTTGTQQNKVLGNPSGNGTGEPGAGSYLGPYDTRAGNANQKSRHAIIYPQALLSAIPVNSIINSLQFRRAEQSGSTQAVPGNSVIKIYLRNEAADNFGSATFDWNMILPGAVNPAVLVYGGEASPLVGNSGGWKTVPFQVPFTYTGGNLAVFIEYLQKGSVISGTDVLWVYDNGGSQPLYSITTYPNQLYATKYTATTSTISDNLTANNERRPVITVGYYTPDVLPVSLVRFTAVKKGSGVLLSWLASTEINSAGFEVQRSKDGGYFETLDFISSKAVNGNGSSAMDYEFTDNYPLSGTAYYRLLQKDKDGRGVYSSIVPVKKTDSGLSLVTLYPNPVKEKLTALLTVEKAGPATITVHDMNGRVIVHFNKKLVAGYNRIEMEMTKAAGSIYLLQVETANGEKLQQKFIKN